MLGKIVWVSPKSCLVAIPEYDEDGDASVFVNGTGLEGTLGCPVEITVIGEPVIQSERTKLADGTRVTRRTLTKVDAEITKISPAEIRAKARDYSGLVPK